MEKIEMPDVPEKRYWRQRREALSFRKKVLTSIIEDDLKDIENIDMDEETNIADLPISGYLFEDENEAMAWAKEEEEYERRKAEKRIVKKIMEL